MNDFINQMEPWFDEKEADACYEYMKSGGWVMEHKKTREFEKMICDYTKAIYCHIVNNGTIALSIALLAVGIKPGDKVIAPDLTMIASVNSVKLIGAEFILVDVEEKTLCLDINKTEKLIKKDKNIKAVIHVSLMTRCNDIERLVEICNSNNVYLIEDSAQSLGSFYKNRHLGTFGDIGSFSFSMPKIISTGQGGALITDNRELSDKIWQIKNFGRDRGGIDIHNIFGINSKTTDVQSVIGIEQMKKLPYRVNRIREMWDLYYEKLSDHKDIFMIKTENPKWIPWLIDIYVENRSDLALFLKSKNIGTRPIYPPIHSQRVYPELNGMSFPISEYYSNMGLWLPSSTKLTNEQILYICNCVKQFYNS